MSSEQAPRFQFPMLGFYRSKEGPENELFFGFESDIDLRTATRDAAASRPGMILVDNSGRTWEIRSLRFGRVTTPWWSRVLCELFGQSGSIVHEVQQEFVPLAPIAWDEVKARVCASLDRNIEDWVDYDGVGGQDGPLDEKELIRKAKDGVQRATTVSELFQGIDAAWPY